ncbi:MAG: NAD(P)/FAD-dependent oxidoreductase [Deltaproteobacteria bacterium]|nr:NAD(P)/FAD-dependent oxidoreductase [Deltaproteobacteria bacterium]
MSHSVQHTPTSGTPSVEHFDALVIGAGVSGLYHLYRLKQLGLNAKIFEAGGGVGGTWYWNRYPGARFDSESYSYGYSFSAELLQDWDWKEHFSAQPETERYLNYVADKFDLRRHIQFDAHISSLVYDDKANLWDVKTEQDHHVRARFVIAAVGILSATYVPDIPGIDSFQGKSFHTSRWPHEKVDFTKQRVAVIGTGATAVQLITEIAKEVGHLTVFQRTPNFCMPLRNALISPEEQKKIKASYPDIFKKCNETIGAFLHQFDPRSALAVTPEEREAFYEEIWAEPGFRKWFGNFRDIMNDRAANDTFAEFVRNKIRQRVTDPVIAEKLCPNDHPFGSKRIPLESGYYEVYNQDNVLLVDIRETPIERVTSEGIKTNDTEYEFDVIIYATGFDAVTGELTRMDIRGEGGQQLKDKWADGPSTYLGLQTAGFPNLFIANGAVFCNFPRCAEVVAEWVSECIGYMRQRNLTRIEPSKEAETTWTEHDISLTVGKLFTESSGWFLGANIPGKKRQYLLYAGGAPVYRQKCAEVAANGYEGFVLR